MLEEINFRLYVQTLKAVLTLWFKHPHPNPCVQRLQLLILVSVSSPHFHLWAEGRRDISPRPLCLHIH